VDLNCFVCFDLTLLYNSLLYEERGDGEPAQRGTFSILSTCLITLGLCVWAAMHFNIPEHKSKGRQFRRKVGWLIMGLLAPEMVRRSATRTSDSNLPRPGRVHRI
jgi:hypothetical protein